MVGARGIPLQCLAVALTLHVAVVIAGEFSKPFNVSYDHRALIIDGKCRMLISAGIHYARATPQMWPDLIAKSKEGGADVIQTYVFWSGHEPVRGQYYFEGRYDIVKFVKLVGSSGLCLHLQIGPYVCAEWNFGIYVSDDDISYWEDNSVKPALSIDSMRDLVRIFVNGLYAGSKVGHWVKVEQPIQLKQGYNDLVLLSETVGLQNYGAFYEIDGGRV